MTINELFADGMMTSLGLLKNTLADFSDAEMLKRPAPAANHAAWQLGHLTASEAKMINSVTPGAVPSLPAGFADKFKKEMARSDNPADFLKKDELIAQLEGVRKAAAQWAMGLRAEDLSREAPEAIRGFCPTVGHLVTMVPNHTYMHIGQFQVIRRALGKPILF